MKSRWSKSVAVTTALSAAVSTWMIPAWSSAAPSEPEVVIAPIQVKGSLAEDAIGKLRVHASEGLRRAGIPAVTPGGAAEKCDAACAAGLVEQERATHALLVAIEVEGRDFQLRTSVLDANGNVVTSADQACDICGIEEVGKLVEADAAALGKQLGILGRPAQVTIASTPSGATVRIDGRKRGVTPLELELPAGEHELDVRLEGHFPREKQVTVVEGVIQSVDIDLQAVPEKQRNEPLWISGWVGLSTGIGLLAAGVPLLILHHRPKTDQCTGDDIDATGLCRYRYTTRPAGATLAAVGGALLITGIVLVIKGRTGGGNQGGDTARFQPTLDGFRVTLPPLAQLR